MQQKYLKNILILASMLLSSCTQEPANIIIHSTNSPTKAGFLLSNPYKVRVKAGDTLYSIAREYNVEIRAMIESNRLRPPYILIPGQTVKLPKAAFHKVSDSDTLYAISRSYGVDIGRLAQKNHITPPYSLKKGQRLLLPSPAENNFATNFTTQDTKYNYNTAATSEISSSVSSSNLSPISKSNHYASGNEIKPAFNYSSEKEFASNDKQKVPTPVRKGNNAQMASLKTQQSSAFIQPQSAPAHSISKTSPYTKTGRIRFNWPVSGKIISGFGPKKGGLYNDGVNIAAKEGVPIKAAEGGDVVYSGNELRGYGNMLLIKHNNGYLTAYAHVDDFMVRKGDIVKKGQLIAHVGQTGHVSSPQLHFSIRRGRKAIDPQKYLSTY